MDLTLSSRDLAWRSPLTLVLLGAGVLFLGLALRTFLFPASAAAFYGVETKAAEAFVFVQAYGARNIVISLLALTFIGLDHRRALAALLAGAALVAALDAVIMFGWSGAAGAAKHLLYVGVLGALALVTLRHSSKRQTART
jgi:Domain of unknown function (DUF4267)